MGTLYVQTTGSATNSGSTDQNAANLSGAAATVSGDVVTLDGSPDLSGLVTSGANQSSIHLNDATNTNRKIFWITAFDDVANTVTVDVAPTGVTSSAWAIGGRHVLTNASIEGAVRAGDTVIFNDTPAAQAATMWTFRNSGDATSGFAKIRGKTGVRPVLNTTNTSSCVSVNNQTNCWIENLEIDQDGATGSGITSLGAGTVIYNVKVSDCGSGDGIVAGAVCRIIGCEITGSADDGILVTSSGVIIWGNHVHDNAGDGIEVSVANPTGVIAFNTIDTNTGRGILFSGAPTNQSGQIAVACNTIYGNGSSGLEVTDADQALTLLNNLFQDNGDAAGESNVEWVAGNAELVSFHGWNLLYDNTGADAPINFTVNAQVANSELTSDPQLGSPAAGDFTPGSSSPAKAAGFPGQLLGGDLGYLDIGAMQRQEPAGGGSGATRLVGGVLAS